MFTLEDLGRRLRDKRGALGIRAAAKEIGISHATLSRVERGFLPDLENYAKICKWLGINPTKALAKKGTKEGTAMVQVHFRKEKTSSPETAEALAQMILAAQVALNAESKRG
jgi:transcriptional regulator with XRE-family HTH domain